MRRALFALATSALCFATPAYAQVRADQDTAAALVRVIAAPVDSATRTTGPRQPVFEQQATVAEAVRLRGPLTATFPLGSVQADMSLPAGAELFRVRFEREAALTAYCAATTVHTNVGPQRPARVGRACLSDGDNDGAFDRLWYMYVPIGAGGDGAGGWVIHPYSRIAGGLVYSVAGESLAAPVAYEAAPQHGIAPFALVIEYIQFGRSLAFQLRQRDGAGNALTEIGTEAFGGRRFSSDSEFPQTLSLLGAEIEIVSRDEAGVISYHVRRGFTESEPLALTNLPPPAPPPPAPPRR